MTGDSTEVCTLVEVSSDIPSNDTSAEQEDFLSQFEAFATGSKGLDDDKKNQKSKDTNFMSSFEVFASESKTFTTVIEDDGADDLNIVEEFDVGSGSQQSETIDEDAFNEGLEYDSNKDEESENKDPNLWYYFPHLKTFSAVHALS